MGLTSLRVRVGSPATPRVTEEIEFPVDAGTVESVVPARILRRLGIKPLSAEEFHLSGKISG